MSVRIAQIRMFVFVLSLLGRSSAGARLIVRCRNSRLAQSLLDLLVGYRSTFSSFAEAQNCAHRYISAGHEHPDDIRFHTSIADTLRESDYPVLFYLLPVSSGLHRVFDLGGNVGNLFYAYERHLGFPEDLQWWVYDLPEKMPFGEKLAQEKNEHRIHFTNQLAAASGVDLFISSVHSQEELVREMRDLGYLLRATWPVHERKLWVPLHPDHSNGHYTGFYFEKSA